MKTEGDDTGVVYLQKLWFPFRRRDFARDDSMTKERVPGGLNFALAVTVNSVN